MSGETYYTVLGISKTATQDEIERAHRNFVEAYHVLSDPTQRSSYDQQLAQYGSQNAAFRPPPPPKAATTSPLRPLRFANNRLTYTDQNTLCPSCGSTVFEMRTYGGSWDDADTHCAGCGKLIHSAWEM